MWNMYTVVSACCTLEFHKNAAALDKVLKKTCTNGTSKHTVLGVKSHSMWA